MESQCCLELEVLEDRLAPAILFTPQFGAQTVSGPANNGNVLSSPDIHLIFWGGTYWQGNPTDPSIGAIQTAVKNMIASSYLTPLTEYGSDGLATYDSTRDQIALSNPAQNFTEASLHSVIDTVISALAGQGVPTPNQATNPPFYLVITPPGISSDLANAAGYNNFYYWGASQTATSFAWAGINPNGNPALEDVSVVLSHEIVERISAGNGPGQGIVTTHGATWTGGGDFQISDAEAHDYSYRESNGVLVQSYWSQQAQTYVVPTGQQQNVMVNNGVLTLVGDQFGASYADQVNVTRTNAGVLQVTLNGEIVQFENPVYFSQVRITAVQVHVGTGADSVRVDASVTIPVTVNNLANNMQSTTQGDGSTLYTAPVPRADLKPYRPNDWDGALVASIQTGTHTLAPTILATDTVYVDWAAVNQGTAATAVVFSSQLFLDGVLNNTWTTPPPLDSNFYTHVDDWSLGQLTPGSHTVTLIIDSSAAITESDEANNSTSITLTVKQPANLTSGNSTSLTVGALGTFTLTTAGFPKPTLSETGTLPQGVSFHDNGNGTATLSGTPFAGTAGSYPLTITASNGVGADATQSFTLTVIQPPVVPVVVVTADAGGPPLVQIFTPSGTPVAQFYAYGPTFTGGVRVASGDVNGDGVPDLFTSPGPTGSPVVNVFNGKTFALLRQIPVYGVTFTLGVNVTLGDVLPASPGLELITAPDAGGAPYVNVFNPTTGAFLKQLLVYGETFTLGVRVTTGVLQGQTRILVAPEAGGLPVVNVFDATSGALVKSMHVYGDSFTGGVFLTTGATNGGGTQLFVGPGSSGSPFLNVFDLAAGTYLHTYQVYGLTFTAGLRLGSVDADGDGTADVVIGPGRTGSPIVKVVRASDGAVLASFSAFDASMTAGLFVLGSSR